MLRPVLRLSLSSVFVLLTACGDDVVVTTSGDSSSGTTSEETSTTNAPTTTPTTEGPTTTVTTTVTTGTTDATETSTTVDTTTGTTTDTAGDTDTDTDTDTGGPVCDNGVIEEGEACDGDDLAGQDCIGLGFDAGTLACADDCALDDSGCSLFSCGNGTLDGNETCDADDLGGQDCLMQGFEGGTLACAANCGSFDATACFKCGDEILNGVEVCDGADVGAATCMSQGFDDGVLGCAVDCSAFDNAGCFSCGDNMVGGAEVCDGTDLAGKDCVSEGFEAGALACADDCGGFNTAACTSCGDDKAMGEEECDGPDLKSNSCATQGADYGILVCTADCVFDDSACVSTIDETEPNDDGMTAVNVNDFSAANANGPYTASTVIHGAITPAGDDDIYAVTNNLAGFQNLRVETFDADGPGNCAASVDTFVEIRSAANVLLASNDDDGAGPCSLIPNYPLAGGETVYVRVIEFGDNAAIADYFVDMQLTPVVCGDGIGGAGEQCDDGNLVANDGCSPTCTIEGAVTEIEPNNTNVQADATGIVATGTVKYAGAIIPASDVDRYRIDLGAPQFMRFESFSALNNCVGLTTVLRLVNGANQPIINDTEAAGIGGCGSLVFPVPMGTSYLQIEETGTNALVPSYVLEFAQLSDAGTESEPNEDLASADTNVQLAPSDSIVFGDHTTNIDSDFYAIDVPAGASLRLETIEGDRAVETCESNGVDSRLTLFNSMGVQLVDDDDGGRGFCSAIDGTGTVPRHPGAHNLAAGTYYVQVRAANSAQVSAAGQFIYRLVTTVRKP